MSGGGAGIPRLPVDWTTDCGDYVHDLAWSPDGRRLAVASAGGRVHVLDAAGGALVWVQDGHLLAATRVAWSPDGACLASGGQDGRVALWDADTGEERASLTAGRGWVQDLAWSADGRLATAIGRCLCLWDGHGRLWQDWGDADSTLTGLAWLPDGHLTSCCYGGVRLWRPEQQASVKQFEFQGSLLVLAVSPDGRWLAAGCQDRMVQLWERSSGRELTMGGYSSKVQHLGWDHTARYLASANQGSLVVWDCSGPGPEDREPAFLPLHDQPIKHLSFSNGRDRVATAGGDGLAVIVRMRDRRALRALMADEPLSRLAWDGGDGRLALAGARGGVSLHTVADSDN